MPEFFIKVYLDHFKLKNKGEVVKCIAETPLDDSDDNPFDTKKVKRKGLTSKQADKKTILKRSRKK